MAYVTGLFIYNVDEWLIKEERIVRKASVIPARPSCKHIELETKGLKLKKDTPNYCPECGVKTSVIPEEKITEIKEKVFLGKYMNDLFNQNNCLCEGAKDCLNCRYKCSCGPADGCPYCKNGEHYPIYDERPEYINLFDNESYPELCRHYRGPCKKCVEDYFRDLKCYYLKGGYKLSYVHGHFFIPYNIIFKNDCEDNKVIDIDTDLLYFRQKILEYCEINGIVGDFSVKYFYGI